MLNNTQLQTLKTQYQTLQTTLIADFLNHPDLVENFVLARASGVDQLLNDIWREFAMDDALCLVAVGGYGRAELHLHSDIDLLIIIPNNTHQTYQKSIGEFLTFLWDVGLEVGHSTRDMSDCVSEIEDLSVVTNLLESRFLMGNESLFFQMKAMIKNSDWSSQSFFVEKQKEQHNRHLHFSDTAYNLEPNLKESPGGLRDIHTIAWVAKWYFDVNHLLDLVKSNYLNKLEFDLLKAGQLFLWKVRFALHVLARRREDRLAFQYQKEVATMLGYVDTEQIAVEQFMRDYYRTVSKIARFNDILLHLLEDKVLHAQTLNPRFTINYGYIQASNAEVFVRNPETLIEIFLLIAKHNYVRGIGAKTLRQMQSDIHLMDSDYHKKRKNNRLFIELLQQNQGINKALKLMNRYGILERYVPAFGKITGLMQYDLYHAYTVDQHTLFVIRNLRRFFVADFAKEFDLCSEIAQTIKKPELLLLAGLFHDIAKGRGGDHAELGSVDATQFCKHHQLRPQDSALVSGLVAKHLLMSHTAQKKDIEDFEVIETFANAVGSVNFLNFLYLLTVADIRATRPDLWNNWRDALLKKLFYKTKNHLENRQIKAPDINQQIKTIQREVAIQAQQQGILPATIERIFADLPKDYFLHYEPEDILWHLHLLHKDPTKMQVASKISEHNVVDIFVYSDDSEGLFLKLVGIIERLGLDVVNAKILTTQHKKTYNTLSILFDEMLEKININQEIEAELRRDNVSVMALSNKLAHRHFDHRMSIHFSYNETWNLTQININVIDKQGILSNIAYVFYQLGILIFNARITTLGERVEDIFFISNRHHQPLNKAEKRVLEKTLIEKL